MDLELTEEQQALADAVVGLLEGADARRRGRDSEPLGFDDGLWRELNRSGVPALAAEGAGTLELALVAEACGRFAAPVPVVEALVALRVLDEAGVDERAAEVATGDELATVALHAARAGTWRLVPAGAVAGTVVGLRGEALVASRAAPPGSGPANLGGAPIADRAADGDDVVVLARTPDALAVAERMVDTWTALTAAALAGLGRGAVDLAVAHVTTREQFGRPLGAFQAVAHRLADVATRIDGAQLLAYEAAWNLDGAPSDASRLASMAFVFAAEAARDAAATSLHLHGGYGVAVDSDVQRAFRCASAWPLALGDPRGELQRIASLTYDGG